MNNPLNNPPVKVTQNIARRMNDTERYQEIERRVNDAAVDVMARRRHINRLQEDLERNTGLQEDVRDAFQNTNMIDQMFENGLPTVVHKALAHCFSVLPRRPITAAEIALEMFLEALVPEMLVVVLERERDA